MGNSGLFEIIQEKLNGNSLRRLDGKISERSLETELTEIINYCFDQSKNHFQNLHDHVRNYQEMIDALDDEEIATVIKACYAGNEDVITFNRHLWNSSVAPPEKLVHDFKNSYNTFSLFWGNNFQNKRNLLIRAIPGHASQGHSTFRGGDTYPNTTTKDAVIAISDLAPEYKLRSYEQFKRESMREIDEFVYFTENLFRQWEKFIEEPPMALDRDGRSLFGLPILKKPGMKVPILEWWRAAYFGGNFDNYDIRSAANKKYGFESGGGECYPGDLEVLKDFNIGLHELSNLNYSIPLLNVLSSDRRINVLKKMGVILDGEVDLEKLSDKELNWRTIKDKGIRNRDFPGKDVVNLYVRFSKGRGVMDDNEVLIGGFLPLTITEKDYWLSEDVLTARIIAVKLMDEIDTKEKDAEIIITGGLDQTIADYYNLLFRKHCEDKRFRDKLRIRTLSGSEKPYNLLPQSVLQDFTAAGYITDIPIHSSQAYFMLRQMKGVERKKATCTFKEILNLAYENAYTRGLDYRRIVQGQSRSIPNIRVGFHRIKWHKVRSVMHERLNLVYKPCDRERNLYQFFERQKANGNGKC